MFKIIEDYEMKKINEVATGAMNKTTDGLKVRQNHLSLCCFGGVPSKVIVRIFDPLILTSAVFPFSLT